MSNIDLKRSGDLTIQPLNLSKSNLINLDYKGLQITLNEDGWFNATTAAAYYNKRPTDWLSLSSTKEYIATLCDIFRSEESSLLKIKRGGKGKNDSTWFHPQLAVPFARWLDVRFAVWCDAQINNLLRGTHPHYDWKRIRHESSSSYKVMSALVQLTREKEGKETKFFHYANEAKLVNYAMTGEYKPLSRDELNYDDLDLLCKLEELNSVLIGYGVSRDERKNVLLKKVSDFRLMITD